MKSFFLMVDTVTMKGVRINLAYVKLYHTDTYEGQKVTKIIIDSDWAYYAKNTVEEIDAMLVGQDGLKKA